MRFPTCAAQRADEADVEWLGSILLYTVGKNLSGSPISAALLRSLIADPLGVKE